MKKRKEMKKDYSRRICITTCISITGNEDKGSAIFRQYDVEIEPLTLLDKTIIYIVNKDYYVALTPEGGLGNIPNGSYDLLNGETIIVDHIKNLPTVELDDDFCKKLVDEIKNLF